MRLAPLVAPSGPKRPELRAGAVQTGLRPSFAFSVMRYRQIARFSEWQSTREEVPEEVFALAKISFKAAVESAQKRPKNALALVPLGHGNVPGLDKFGYSDVNCGISNGLTCLKMYRPISPCVLDGSEDIGGLSRIGRSAWLWSRQPGDMPGVCQRHRPI
jgi:hypothetical protein